MRVLIIRLGSLGDVVLTTAAFHSIIRAHPDSKIYFLLKKRYVRLLDGLVPPERILSFSEQDNTLSGLIALIKRLWGYRFDYIIDLQATLRSVFISELTPGKTFRVRKGSFARRMAVRMRRKPRNGKPMYERFIDAVRPMGGEAALPALAVPLQDREKVASALMLNGVRVGKPYTVLHPGAKWQLKRWPLGNFVKLGKMLEKNGMNVILVFGSGEKPSAEEFSFPFPVVSGINLAGLKGLIAGAALFIGNDSGPAHIAAALSIPTVSIFGPTHPVLGFAPVGKKVLSITLNMDCSPCTLHGEGKCALYNSPRCLDELTPDIVYSRVMEFLNNKE